ncbi:hypothetical protein LshimejAT787_0602230 [Lyophyllum shimeji]|uniref:Uncharacterized protein n=1 Tax=Lyophyllum shimeji TaxID=47721 RepID=A0A9P3PPL0_LYOSH|nr:hypothetical protein LshimejAT787_0602230 [Lyophyllum shimeji]
MSETVIREVANGVWTFSRPFARYGVVPVGGRSTAIKMKNGGVWVLASTPLEPETKAKLDELGGVKYIVGADAVHHLFLGDFKKAYPDAKLIAPKEAIERHGDKNLVFDGAWGRDLPNTRYGFEDEIKHRFFSGFVNKDVVFFHPDSKVLIEADLLMNLPANEQYSKSRASPKLPLFGGFTPTSWFHPRFLWYLGKDKEAMRRDAKTVAGWDFEKIIPCHGDVIERDAKKAWEEAFKFYLD